MRKRPPDDPLSEEEKRQWKELASQVKPLRGGKSKKQEAPVPPMPKKNEPAIRVTKKDYIPPATPAHKQDKPLAVGAYANIDRNTADRFRKGEAPIDATLDLHGMTREKAQRALGNFLERQRERGSRCVLIVTGQGKRPDMQKDVFDQQDRGILREMLPVWLADFRDIVLAFDVAKQRHGGRGAFYVLLRRKR